MATPTTVPVQRSLCHRCSNQIVKAFAVWKHQPAYRWFRITPSASASAQLMNTEMREINIYLASWFVCRAETVSPFGRPIDRRFDVADTNIEHRELNKSSRLTNDFDLRDRVTCKSSNEIVH